MSKPLIHFRIGAAAMRTILRAICFTACLLTSGCNDVFPGKANLKEKGYTEEIAIQRDHKRLAECLTRKLDEKPKNIALASVRVMRTVTSVDGNEIELEGDLPALAGYLAWSATITQTSPGQSVVKLTARKSYYGWPAPQLYFSDYLRESIQGCSAA